jgi:hypothetical protein
MVGSEVTVYKRIFSDDESRLTVTRITRTQVTLSDGHRYSLATGYRAGQGSKWNKPFVAMEDCLRLRGITKGPR